LLTKSCATKIRANNGIKVNRPFGVMHVDLLPDFVGLKVYGGYDTQDSGFRVDEVG
jgi:hypothetical protein